MLHPRTGRRSAWVACVIFLGLTSVALGAESKTRREAPGVVVSFEGGVVGDNVSTVLSAIAKSAAGLPTEEYVVKPGDNLCKILDERQYPKPCTKLGTFIDTLNPKTRPFARGIRGMLKPGEKIRLPRIELVGYQAVNNYSKANSFQAQMANSVQTNYKDLGVRNIVRSPDQITVEYRAYELYIPAKSDETAVALAKALTPLSSPNIFIDVLRETKTPVKLNSIPSLREVRESCSDASIKGKTFRYVELSDVDADLQSVLQLPPPEPVTVYIIDVPVASAPSLFPALGAAPANASWDCKWKEFVVGFHHATHLAGIIASQDKGYGFLGIAPHAKIEPFEWALPVGDGRKVTAASATRHLDLANLMSDNAAGRLPLKVYLAAASFDRPLPGQPASTLLQDAAARLTSRLPRTIKNSRPLLIVAAGQPEENEQPIEFGTRSNMLPQSLGDLGNVIVVTACDVCKGAVKLMEATHRSHPAEKLVHVAAPGGSEIPGWISNEEIGASSGTSQAAAYVSGVVAAMLGYYEYTTPESVKSRLQVTSRPLDPRPEGQPHPDAVRLAAGVVDPMMALLDPRKHWVKDGRGWREIKIRSWPREPIQFANRDGAQIFHQGKDILRLVKSPDVTGQPKSWTAYIDLSTGQNREGGAVGREELLSFAARQTLALCDGSSIALDTFDDFIPSIDKVRSNACASR